MSTNEYGGAAGGGGGGEVVMGGGGSTGKALAFTQLPINQHNRHYFWLSFYTRRKE